MSVIQWPTISGGGGITKYPNLAGFPGSASVGDLGIAEDTQLIYAWSGTAWVQIKATPSGSAGGELAGSYPNPTVVASTTTSNNSLVRRDASGNIQGATFNASGATASRAAILDASKNLASSTVTDTELGYVSGVTSAIQTQIDSKEPTITTLPISKGGTNSSTALNNNRVIISSGGKITEQTAITASRALASDASGLPVASSTTATELGYVSGVTSALQTQLDAKATYASMLVSNTKYVAKNGNDTTGDGSFAKPYLTVQKGIDSASVGGSVIVMPGNYTENLSITKQMNIFGYGTYSWQRTLILGKLSITSTSSVGLVHIGFQTSANAALEISASGAVRFESCTFERLGGGACVTVSGASTGGIYFINTYVSGDFENATTVPYPVVVMGSTAAEMKIKSTGAGAYTRVEFCSEIGPVTHSAGSLVICNTRGIVKDGSGNCITSTANSGGINLLALINVAMQQEDATYGKINKTGTCGWAIQACNRSTSTDVLTGSRVNFTMFSDDISANRTPTNYSAANSDIKTHLAGIDTALGTKEPAITTLPIAKGGTNSSTALNNNRVMISSGGAVVETAAITASRALASDASGLPVASATTSTELGYVSGVTSSIQTQLNGKEPTITTLPISKGGTNSNTALNNNRIMISSSGAIVETAAITASRALASDASGLPVASATTSTELGYVSGVTSSIQTQLNGKEPTITTLSATKGGLGTDASAFTGVLKSSAGVFSASAIVDADISASAGIVDTKLATISTAGKVSNSATTATSSRGNSTIVARDGVGKFEANEVNVYNATLENDGAGGSGSTTYYAGTAPSSPAANYLKLYFKSDQKLYKKNSSGTETEIGSGAVFSSLVSVSSDVTLTAGALHLVDTSAARALTLPAAASLLVVTVKDSTGSAATNNITITPASGTIDGAASYTIDAAYMSVMIVSNGTNWFVV